VSGEPKSGGGDVTVAIPVRDGGALLERTFSALARQSVAHELLVCDSGSSDGSRELAQARGARVIEIPPERYSHGGTRDLLMSEAAGARVAFLSQDAEPADERWLECLLGGFDLAEDVSLVYGPYRPRADAPLAVRIELEQWFASLAPDGRPSVERLVPEERSAPVAELIGRRGFFSDANACVSREAWQRVPFREVAYAEDRLLALDMLRAGYAKAFVPAAAVLHSHSYTPTQELRRCFDEWRALREVYGWREPATPRHALREVRGSLGRARRDPQVAAMPAPRRLAALGGVASHTAVRLAGAMLGSRAERLPPALRRRLSIERRTDFAALDYDTPAQHPPTQEHAP
jgi:rhamnosyltransferase